LKTPLGLLGVVEGGAGDSGIWKEVEEEKTWMKLEDSMEGVEDFRVSRSRSLRRIVVMEIMSEFVGGGEEEVIIPSICFERAEQVGAFVGFVDSGVEEVENHDEEVEGEGGR